MTGKSPAAVYNQGKQAAEDPMISVCINTCDRPNYLALLLTSLCHQTYKSFEVVIVDDGKECCLPDGSKGASAEKFLKESGVPVLVVRNGSQIGLAKSRNVACENAKNDTVVKLDDDHFCDSNFLLSMVKAFSAAERPGCIGAVFPLVRDGLSLSSSVPAVFGDIRAGGYEDQQLLLYPPGTPLVVPAMSVRGIMGYHKDPSIKHPERLSHVSHREDTIFSLLYLQKGYKNYVCPSAVAYHLYAPSGGCRSFKDADRQRGDDEQIFSDFWNANKEAFK